MNHFNQIANSWDTPEKIKMCQLYAEQIAHHLVKKDALKILEVGCGTGLLGSYFINDKNYFIGIDSSEGMLEVFKQKFKEYKNVHAYLINLENRPFKENNFDLIISSMAFHHLKDPEQMILKLKNMLSKDGVIAIVDLDLEDGSFHPNLKQMGVEHFGFSKDHTDIWAKNAGFKNYKREIVNIIKKNTKEYPIFLATFFN